MSSTFVDNTVLAEKINEQGLSFLKDGKKIRAIELTRSVLDSLGVPGESDALSFKPDWSARKLPAKLGEYLAEDGRCLSKREIAEFTPVLPVTEQQFSGVRKNIENLRETYAPKIQPCLKLA